MRVLSFDTETTSEKPETCRVVQIGAVMFDLAADTHDIWMDEITDPGLESSDAATAIHGIGPDQWRGKRADEDAMRELHTRIRDALVQDTIDGIAPFVMAGHNGKWFDIPIMLRLVGEAEMFGVPFIDTMVCAQRLLPLAPSHRLTTNPNEPAKMGLIEFLELGEVENAHTAYGDALMVLRLVKYFMAALEKTPLELAQWCGEVRILKYCHFGRHKGKLWGQPKNGEDPKAYVPSGQAWWIAQNFGPSPDLEATIKRHYGYTFKCRR